MIPTPSTPRPPRRRRLVAIGSGLGLGLLMGLVPTAPASAASHREPVTGLASVDRTLGSADDVALHPSVSDDGRLIAFESRADDLVAGDTNGRVDIFVRDTLASTTVKITRSYVTGHQADGSSANASISGSGRYVAYESLATNLVPLDTNGTRDVFVHDMITGTTRRVSVPDGGGQHYAASRNADISASGLHIAFEADGGLVGGDSNGKPDVYVHDIVTEHTERVSVDTGEIGMVDGYRPSISQDGKVIAFESFHSEVPYVDGYRDIYIRDRNGSGSTNQESIHIQGGSPSNGHSFAPSISEDGRVIAFESEATNLHDGGVADTNGVRDVLVRDRVAHTTVRASVGPQGLEKPDEAVGAQLDDAGTKVQFTSRSAFVDADSNDRPDVFVRDLTNGVTVRRSVGTLGDQVYGDMLTATDLSGDGTVSAWSQRVGSHPFPSIWFRGSFETGPYDSPIDMVRRLHQAFGTTLPVNQEGVVHNRLRSGIWSSEHLAVELAHGTFDDVRGPVIRLYWAFFERRPEQAGLDFWMAQREGGRSLGSIAQFFATSPEFTTLYGNTSNSAFITLVYQNVLDRDPDAAGLAYWKGQLDQGHSTRGTMMIGFSESLEGRLLMRGEVDTILLHVGLLGSVPSAAAFTAGVTLLEGGDGQVSEVLAHQILVSPELAAHVG